MKMVEVKTAELSGAALEFMSHMADVSPSDGYVYGMRAGWAAHFDCVFFMRGGEKHELVSLGVPCPVSRERGRIAAKLGDVVSVPAELVNGGDV